MRGDAASVTRVKAKRIFEHDDSRCPVAQPSAMPTGMSKITTLFPTHIYREDKAAPDTLRAELEVASLSLAHDDDVGNRWCEKHGYAGYTSYGSNIDLAASVPSLPPPREDILDKHAMAFAKAMHWDIGKGRPDLRLTLGQCAA